MSNTADLDTVLDAATALAGLRIAPEWRDGVRLHLALSLRMARLVGEFPLPDELDPAPVFRA